jgi:hypothetical protein
MFFDAIRSVIGERDGLGIVRPENYDGSCDYRVTFSWLLNNDPERLNKRSKNLVIVITQEAVADYHDAPQNVQERAIEMLRDLIAQNLETYDPNHAAPYMTEEPSEQWLFTSADIVVY